ncbi:hypothetical protein, partial [Methylobacterium tarhaniae]|uniref:hypothetical protein n=1 Tax=Methylobacterium tarhaniae TaxID=1187852 RepID=UPI001ABF62C2
VLLGALNRAYLPTGRVHGPIHLIFANGSMIGAHSDDAIRAELSSLSDKVSIVRVAGDHFGMVRDAQQTSAAFPI